MGVNRQRDEGLRCPFRERSGSCRWAAPIRYLLTGLLSTPCALVPWGYPETIQFVHVLDLSDSVDNLIKGAKSQTRHSVSITQACTSESPEPSHLFSCSSPSSP